MRKTLHVGSLTVALALLVGGGTACKKDKEEAPATIAASATPASIPVATIVGEAPIRLGDVKRYPDKEKAATGAVRTLEKDVKVYNEPDDKTKDVAKLPKDLSVFRLAELAPDWMLVEFPAGGGKVVPGWVQSKYLDTKVDQKADRATVAKQQTVAVVDPEVTTDAGAAPSGQAANSQADASAPAGDAGAGSAAATAQADAGTAPAAATATATADAGSAATAQQKQATTPEQEAAARAARDQAAAAAAAAARQGR